MPGPKSLSAELHLIKGNPSKLTQDKLKKDAVGPEPALPPAPSYLNGVAKREWKRLGKELLSYHLVSKLDLVTLAIYCDTYSKWQAITAEISRNGSTLENIGGLVQETHMETRVPTGEAIMALKYAEALRRLSQEFGLTPAARSKVNFGGASIKEPKVDEAKNKNDPSRFFNR